MKYYKKHVLSEKELDDSTMVCTVCFRQVNHRQGGTVVRHPDLGVPICKECKKFYHTGEWKRGEDGYFEFCRWCAHGGDLLCCDSCSNAFCKKCIKRNLGRTKVTEIEEVEQWLCLACEPKQIWKQRSMFYSIWLYQRKLMVIEQEKELKMKREAKTNFIEETLKDGFDVNKILGNYMDRAKKSWSRKSHDYTQDDLAKVVKKLRTIIKITHHNLELLDKNLVAGCKKSFPGIYLDKLTASAIPDESGECREREDKLDEERAGNKVKVKKEKGEESNHEKVRKNSDPDQTVTNEESPSKGKKKKKLDKEEKKAKPQKEEEQGDNSGAEIIPNGTGEAVVNGVSHDDEMEVDDLVDKGENEDLAAVEEKTSKDPSDASNGKASRSSDHEASKDMFSDSDTENIDKNRDKGNEDNVKNKSDNSIDEAK